MVSSLIPVPPALELPRQTGDQTPPRVDDGSSSENHSDCTRLPSPSQEVNFHATHPAANRTRGKAIHFRPPLPLKLKLKLSLSRRDNPRLLAPQSLVPSRLFSESTPPGPHYRLRDNTPAADAFIFESLPKLRSLPNSTYLACPVTSPGSCPLPPALLPRLFRWPIPLPSLPPRTGARRK